MKISIQDLKNDINARFGGETDSACFGVVETIYNYKEDSLSLKVAHYLDNDSGKVYKLTFDNVACYRVADERYKNEFKGEKFEGFSFFWQIEKSQFREDFNSWSIYEKIHGSEQFRKLKSYRIIGQNSFVDILTTEEPMIELKEDE